MAKRKTSDNQTSEAEIRHRIVTAGMRLFAIQGWSDTRMSDIAAEADLPLAALYGHCRSKMGVVSLFSAEMDRIMLAGDDPAIAAEPVKDRLFDVIMRRLEAMTPYREGVAQVVHAMRRQPQLAACLAVGPMRRSLDWMLEAARVPSWGPLQAIQRKGLGLVYLNSLKTWLKDDGEDLGKTMAALDKDLKRVDNFVGRRGGGWIRKKAKSDATETTATDN